ncbi:MAG: hypothetical protein ACTH1M_13390, partial [Microbacterium sp.]
MPAAQDQSAGLRAPNNLQRGGSVRAIMVNRQGPRVRLWSMVSGAIAAAAFLSAAEAVALVASPSGGPFVAVGGVVIDVIPRPLKEIAISVFGEFDKIALLIGLGIAALVAAA